MTIDWGGMALVEYFPLLDDVSFPHSGCSRRTIVPDERLGTRRLLPNDGLAGDEQGVYERMNVSGRCTSPRRRTTSFGDVVRNDVADKRVCETEVNSWTGMVTTVYRSVRSFSSSPTGSISERLRIR
jgi:hypothetical protein